MLNIFRNTSIYLLRDKEFVKFITIMPTVLFLLMTVLLPYSDEHNIGVVNNLGGEGEKYLSALRAVEGYQVFEYEEDEIQSKLVGGNVEMAVILDEAILITTLSESEIYGSVELLLQNAGEGSPASEVSINEVPKKTLSVKNILPFMLFKTLTASSLVGALFINEKKNRIRDRILLSGVGTGKYILGVSGAYLFFSCLGSTIFFFIAQIARFDFGLKNDFGFLLMLFFTNLLSVSIMVFASSMLKEEESLWIVGSAVLMPMGLLSGVLFPYDTMPKAMKIAADFCPQRWIAAGIERMQQTGSILSAYPQMLMVTGLAVIFMAGGILISGRKSGKGHA
ncbi:MAG: ABC transporter permease [Ruminococcus flavefaciens]|nr:ABC transporter permease [Ruminococcus flavefaciens]